MSKTRPPIAIVDDDESICRAMSRLLRSAGNGYRYVHIG